MADISQIKISSTTYNIKDSTARTEISTMPHADSGTIAGWTIGETLLYVGDNYYIDSSGNIVAETLETKGNLSVNGATSLNGTLTVTGATKLSGSLTVSGGITSNGHIYLANNTVLFARDTNGSPVCIAGTNSSNDSLFGNATYPTYIRGTSITLQAATSLTSTLTVSGATTLNSSLAVSGDIYKNSLATKQIVNIESIIVTGSSIADGSTTTGTASFTTTSGASYILLSQRCNYGAITALSYSGSTISATMLNASGGTHTMICTIIVISYI